MRKKILLALFTFAITSVVFAGTTESVESNLEQYPPNAGESWKNRLTLYFPNRIMDLLDIGDVSLGFGPTTKIKLWATRYMAFGAGFGGSAKLIKGYNRQYGAGVESGWNGSFMMLSAEDTKMYETTRDVQKYFLYNPGGIPSMNDSVYDFGPDHVIFFQLVPNWHWVSMEKLSFTRLN